MQNETNLGLGSNVETLGAGAADTLNGGGIDASFFSNFIADTVISWVTRLDVDPTVVRYLGAKLGEGCC